MNTRRYPRSLAEAFGPYTDNRLHPMPDNTPPLLVQLLHRLIEKVSGQPDNLESKQ